MGKIAYKCQVQQLLESIHMDLWLLLAVGNPLVIAAAAFGRIRRVSKQALSK
jgi:hypothetical protein